MKKVVGSISARMSLRSPQEKSLTILADVLERIRLGPGADRQQQLEAISKAYPSVTDFEREFPSLCFALATGVGKTRLMGAFISYLFLKGVSRHFFVLAPNLTIYEKLISDFSPDSRKYVFKGITELANNQPVIVTGDNFEQGQGIRFDLVKTKPKEESVRFAGDETVFVQKRLFDVDDPIVINIFNVSKIDTETRKGSSPRIKRLQEYIGESYFDYLSELPDLVLLMDEAHRYRAKAGAKAINELNPILGLELTATPKTAGAQTQEFRNVIYSYALAEAMKDGFVKEPAVATRKDFRVQEYSKEQLELIKLEDGVHNHENVKVELQVYSKQYEKPFVHPFMLVVAQDTNHAKELRELIESEKFFEGRYKGHVIEVHSNLRGEESDEATQRLLAVEEDPETEIVIHVNKLKEGWDVTNLYTIVPLRASASEILTEQTIGRGLRLPYGQRTHVEAIDRLTIIAHDKFQAIIDAANHPDSIIKKTVLIGDGGDVENEKPQAVKILSVVESVLSGTSNKEAVSEASTVIDTKEKREIAVVALDVIKQFERLASSQMLEDPAVKEEICEKVKRILTPSQLKIEGLEEKSVIAPIVDVVTKAVARLSFDIPKVVLVPTSDVSFRFDDFDLVDLTKVRLQPVSQEILIQHLRTNEKTMLSSASQFSREERFEDYLIRTLIDHDQVDYDAHSDLLYKICGQMVAHLRSYLNSEEDVENVLLYHQKSLSEFIFAQMMNHYWESPTDYEVRISKGFSVLRENNYNMAITEKSRDFRSTIVDKKNIRRMLFTGFQKCCYESQKFDSDSERRFAILLEDDEKVVRWMKPAAGQFQIEWKSGLSYEPDFVVETIDEKLICEAKGEVNITQEEVELKARAAARWCEHASSHAEKHGGKRWSYVLIPHEEIQSNRSIEGLKASFTVSYDECMV